jgi:hypothetical protein
LCLWCVQIILTSRTVGAEESNNVLPVNYAKFADMCQEGDTIFVGRYLVTGSEESSVYLTVNPVWEISPRTNI